jgi:hypothetical protein
LFSSLGLDSGCLGEVVNSSTERNLGTLVTLPWASFTGAQVFLPQGSWLSPGMEKRLMGGPYMTKRAEEET